MSTPIGACWKACRRPLLFTLEPRQVSKMEQNLLQNAMVYLLAAVVSVPIAKRLGLGAVLGYLLAGIAIGPWGLGLIRGVRGHPALFRVRRRAAAVPDRPRTGAEAAVGDAPADLRLAAARRCCWSQPAADRRPRCCSASHWKIALIAALGLSLSSTAIALATLDERNLMATPAGTGRVRHPAVPGHRRDPDDRHRAAAGHASTPGRQQRLARRRAGGWR